MIKLKTSISLQKNHEKIKEIKRRWIKLENFIYDKLKLKD
jgi:hypothetical protein